MALPKHQEAVSHQALAAPPTAEQLTRMKRIQELAREFRRPGISEVDQFLSDKRAETQRE